MYQTIILRADANSNTGTGHIMRCIALGQAWKLKGGNVIFITACESEILIERLTIEEFQIIRLKSTYPDKVDLETTLSILKDNVDAWVVIDGYHFDSSYHKVIKTNGHFIMVIDDMAHLNRYYADVLLNQNIYANQKSYSCEPFTQSFLGSEYSLLRQEFKPWRKWKRQFPAVARRLLVSLGGSDQMNLTLKVVNALVKVAIRDLDVKIVTGASYKHIKSLKFAASKASSSIEIIQYVHNMPELMAWADFAVLAGGSTNLEILFMGLPYAAMITAENQRLNVEKLSLLNATINLGWHESLKTEDVTEVLNRLLPSKFLREKMSTNCRNLVDGKGAERVVSALMSYNNN